MSLFDKKKSLLHALGSAKRYTPLDPTIRGGMLKASLGFDPFDKNDRKNAPLPMGRLGRSISPGAPLRGPLEFSGPRHKRPLQSEKLKQALAGNNKQRPKIPTGISAEAEAKRVGRFKRRG